MHHPKWVPIKSLYPTTVSGTPRSQRKIHYAEKLFFEKYILEKGYKTLLALYFLPLYFGKPTFSSIVHQAYSPEREERGK